MVYQTLWGIAARVGVQYYEDYGKVYRSAEVVRESKNSLIGVPLTLGHVESLEKEAYKIVGSVKDVTYDETLGLLLAKFDVNSLGFDFITTRNYKELSIGYSGKLVYDTSVWIDDKGIVGIKGKQYPYDYQLKSVLCNHLALCTNARAGKVARILTPTNKQKLMDTKQVEDIQTLMLGLQAGLTKLEQDVSSLFMVRDNIGILADSVVLLKDNLEKLENQTKQVNTKKETLDLDDLVQKEIKARVETATLLGDSTDLTLNSRDMKLKYLEKINFDASKLSDEAIDSTVAFSLLLRKQEIEKNKNLDKSDRVSSTLKDTMYEDSLDTLPTKILDMSQKIANQRNLLRKGAK